MSERAILHLILALPAKLQATVDPIYSSRSRDIQSLPYYNEPYYNELDPLAP